LFEADGMSWLRPDAENKDGSSRSERTLGWSLAPILGITEGNPILGITEGNPIQGITEGNPSRFRFIFTQTDHHALHDH
jgi:hypothetical protein